MKRVVVFLMALASGWGFASEVGEQAICSEQMPIGGAKREVTEFLEELPGEQRSLLDWFFKCCLQSFGGYVLFGEKPMCVESFPLGGVTPGLAEARAAKMKGFEVVREWGLWEKERKYLFLFTQCYNSQHMIVINRAAFLRVVNEHLSLFRYVLGRTVTAETLLQQLVDHQDRFWEELRYDEALIGVLLGYGAENSLIYSRLIDISKSKCPQNFDVFPFAGCIEAQSPLMGFSSVEEEGNVLRGMIAASNKGTNRPFPIPSFGYVPSAETTCLLDGYERDREVIIEKAGAADFLGVALERVFETIDGKLELPEKGERSMEGSNFTSQIADIARAEAPSFVQGMKDGSKKKELKTDPLEVESKLVVALSQLRCCEGLISATQVFDKVSKRKRWISVIPKKLIYKVISKGEGEAVSSKTRKASFHASWKAIGEEAWLDHKTVKNGDREKLIAGISHLLVGMKKGEQRGAYIHPAYAYGMNIQPSNTGFYVELQLLDFEEGEKEVVPRAVCDLEPTFSYIQGENTTAIPACNLASLSVSELKAVRKGLVKEIESLRRQKSYLSGVDFFSSIEKSRIPFDFSFFCQQVKTSENPSKERVEQSIIDFKARLFSLEGAKEDQSNFPICWL